MVFVRGEVGRSLMTLLRYFIIIFMYFFSRTYVSLRSTVGSGYTFHGQGVAQSAIATDINSNSNTETWMEQILYILINGLILCSILSNKHFGIVTTQIFGH